MLDIETKIEESIKPDIEYRIEDNGYGSYECGSVLGVDVHFELEVDSYPATATLELNDAESEGIVVGEVFELTVHLGPEDHELPLDVSATVDHIEGDRFTFRISHDN